MTLVVALQASDGIVLAGDNRGTFGDPRGFMAVSDVRKKIFKLSDYCGVGIAGPPDVASNLLKNLELQLESQNLVYADDVTLFLRDSFRARYNDWFQQFKIQERPLMGVVIAGYEKSFSGDDLVPRIYTISSEQDYATMLCDQGFCLLGLPLFPTYVVNRLYDMTATKEHVISLAEYIISETGTQDPKVGGPIGIALITADDGYRELDESEVADVHQKNQEELHKFREHFAGR
jgi:20S proteasome alpha/beta subunit